MSSPVWERDALVLREIDADGARNSLITGQKCVRPRWKFAAYNNTTRFTETYITLNASFMNSGFCADESQPARLSCPRLHFLILGLASQYHVAVRSALQLFELLTYNLPPLPDLTAEVLVLRIFIFVYYLKASLFLLFLYFTEVCGKQQLNKCNWKEPEQNSDANPWRSLTLIPDWLTALFAAGDWLSFMAYFPFI